MLFGSYENYFWISWNDRYLDVLIAAFPEIAQSKFGVVTSFDSGPLELTDEERLQGWSQRGDYAYSPRIQSPDALIYDQYDEWYVFTQPTIMPQGEVFVNYMGFRLHTIGDDSDPADDDFEMRQIQARFWQQLKEIAPESYVANGDNLIFVTRNQELYERIQRWEDAATNSPR